MSWTFGKNESQLGFQECLELGKGPLDQLKYPFWGLSKLLGFWYSWYSHTLLLHFYDAYRCHEIACTVFHWCIQSNIVLPLFSIPRQNCKYFFYNWTKSRCLCNFFQWKVTNGWTSKNNEVAGKHLLQLHNSLPNLPLKRHTNVMQKINITCKFCASS